MFHYRWHFAEDADKSGTILPLCMDTALPPDTLRRHKEAFTRRQTDRLYVVGSNETTAPVIDASYRRFLTAMENHLAEQPFLAGRRPGAGDFAIFGQLTQLAGFDPTPSAIAQRMAPRVLAWVQRVEDLSGLEPEESDWLTPDDGAQSYRGILCEIGRVYAPALLANAAAYNQNEAAWETIIDGATWRQQTFPYQAKCLRWIRSQFTDLADTDRLRALEAMAGTGCESLIAPAV